MKQFFRKKSVVMTIDILSALLLVFSMGWGIVCFIGAIAGIPFFNSSQKELGISAGIVLGTWGYMFYETFVKIRISLKLLSDR